MKHNNIDIRDTVVFEGQEGSVIGLNYLTETATVEILTTGSIRTNVPIQELTKKEN